ncbi:unnamed protein product [Angiostrongylus costaricensis]|uniref:Uncharacterized protein n=1 Tax=Angiostrongylus costaricensis TaxID=334426 RepID=A0A0R3PHT5_ANGCS|nr:unnamed protein product [Angiostrongylus costaricensis]
MNPESMHLVSCRTICLTVQQELYVMGQPTGKRLFMRGCALTLARRGLNNHTLSMFDRYDICRRASTLDKSCTRERIKFLMYQSDCAEASTRFCCGVNLQITFRPPFEISNTAIEDSVKGNHIIA